MRITLLEIALVFITILILEKTLAFHLIFIEISCKFIFRKIFYLGFSMFHSLEELSSVYISILISQNTITMQIIIFKLTFIKVAIFIV